MSGDGELMLTVLSSFAQEESKNASDNFKWVARKKFEQCEHRTTSGTQKITRCKHFVKVKLNEMLF